MNNSSLLTWKVVTLIFLIGLMLIPVELVRSVINDRQENQWEAIERINNSAGGSQKVIGPFLWVTYERKSQRSGNGWEENRLADKILYPTVLNIEGDVDVEKRALSLYNIQIFKGKLSIKSSFDLGELKALQEAVSIKKVELHMWNLSSGKRPIKQITDLTVNEQALSFKTDLKRSRSRQDGMSGIQVMIPENIWQQGNMNISFTLPVEGAERLEVIPIGADTNYSLTGNWVDPGFTGSLLPVKHNINQNGFSAVWNYQWADGGVIKLDCKSVWVEPARSYVDWTSETASETTQTSNCINIEHNIPAFSTDFVELVDHYQLSERVIKYAVLIIGLTFAAFFLFEVLKKLPVHPIQYLLVGLALSIFYLLQLALSEYIGFSKSYWIAAGACSGLISFYLSAVLRGWLRALGFGAGLLVLYGVLFWLLHSENNSLLLGTLLLFVILTVGMALTRKLDWYKLAPMSTQGDGKTSPAEPAQVSDGRKTAGQGGPLSEQDEANLHPESQESTERNSFRIWK